MLTQTLKIPRKCHIDRSGDISTSFWRSLTFIRDDKFAKKISYKPTAKLLIKKFNITEQIFGE